MHRAGDKFYCSCTVHALFMGPTTTLFRKKKFKNVSHGTIHTFKNYFGTVFFSFQFSAISKRTLSILKKKKEKKKFIDYIRIKI